MTDRRSFKRKLATVSRHWDAKEYDVALQLIEELLKSWPGNARLHLLWASLVQLQEDPSHSLQEARKTLELAVVLDPMAPAGAIELGHYLDAVEDDPAAAMRAFSEGIAVARRLLIDGLLGQARALLHRDQRKQALECLAEALFLADRIQSADGKKSAHSRLANKLEGGFTIRIEDLLDELFPKHSA
jgi:predicted Zn-dependent protease